MKHSWIDPERKRQLNSSALFITLLLAQYIMPYLIYTQSSTCVDFVKNGCILILKISSKNLGNSMFLTLLHRYMKSDSFAYLFYGVL